MSHLSSGQPRQSAPSCEAHTYDAPDHAAQELVSALPAAGEAHAHFDQQAAAAHDDEHTLGESYQLDDSHASEHSLGADESHDSDRSSGGGDSLASEHSSEADDSHDATPLGRSKPASAYELDSKEGAADWSNIVQGESPSADDLESYDDLFSLQGTVAEARYASRDDASILLASVLATSCWQAEERIVVLAFVRWLEYVADRPAAPKMELLLDEAAKLETSPRSSRDGLPPLPSPTASDGDKKRVVERMLERAGQNYELPAPCSDEVSAAWATWIDRTKRLVRCRRLARRTVSRLLRLRDWRRRASWLALVAWRQHVAEASSHAWRHCCAAANSVVAIVRFDTRWYALRAAWATWCLLDRQASNEARDSISEEVTRVAAEHLERAAAANRELRKAAVKATRKGRQLAARLIFRHATCLGERSLLEDAWRQWTAELRAPRRSSLAIVLSDQQDEKMRAVFAFEPNRGLLRDVFNRYAIGGANYDGSITLVLTLERLWSFAKDFAISPAFASFSLLMQLARDELGRLPTSPHSTSTKSSTNSRRACRKRIQHGGIREEHNAIFLRTSDRKQGAALVFDQFVALLARLALHQAVEDDEDEDDEPDENAPSDLVAALIRAMDCSNGLAKLGLHNKRFNIPKSFAPVARLAWST